MRNKQSFHGFTLVELLVALGTVALLAGIVLTGVFQARNKTRATTCLSNLHQIQIALSSYASDNDGHFPPLLHRISAVSVMPRTYKIWQETIGVMSPSSQLKCPDREMDSRFEAYPNVWQFNGYAMNKNIQAVAGDASVGYSWEGMEVEGIKYPSATVVVFDAMPNTVASICPDIWLWEKIGEWQYENEKPCKYTNISTDSESARITSDQTGGAKRHNGGANYLFVDGHAKWLKPGQISAKSPNTGEHPAFSL